MVKDQSVHGGLRGKEEDNMATSELLDTHVRQKSTCNTHTQTHNIQRGQKLNYYTGGERTIFYIHATVRPATVGTCVIEMESECIMG